MAELHRLIYAKGCSCGFDPVREPTAAELHNCGGSTGTYAFLQHAIHAAKALRARVAELEGYDGPVELCGFIGKGNADGYEEPCPLAEGHDGPHEPGQWVVRND